jgi:hypothetical protein
MGLFKKKPDPISERAKYLNDQIAALECQIKKLSEQPAQVENAPSNLRRAAQSFSAIPQFPSQPRLRSTAVPHGPTVPASLALPLPPAQEPIFEEVDQDRFKVPPETITPAHFNELGVRKYNLLAFWLRLRNHFRGPVTSNPKLVNYLAAGSLQGLRPLRYEKRVARNRFMVLVVFLALALWGLIAVFIRHK